MNYRENEEEKCINYNQLKYEISWMWRIKEASLIPVVIEALPAVTNRFEKWIKKQKLSPKVKMMEKECLFETGRILWKVLDKQWQKKAKALHQRPLVAICCGGKIPGNTINPSKMKKNDNNNKVRSI